MSLENRATSWALSLFDALESPTQIRTRIFAAAGGILVTIAMWAVHLTYPDIFTYLLQTDDWGKLVLGFVLAPPFIVAFTVGSLLYRQAIEPVKNETGPMSAYFYQESATKRWKLLIVAALIAAVNFLLMLVTSGI